MPKPLSPEQIEALRSVPLGEMPNLLKVAAKMAGAKQTDIAEEIGIAASNLSDIFNGKYVDLQLETTRKLGKYFECPVEVLFPEREAA